LILQSAKKQQRALKLKVVTTNGGLHKLVCKTVDASSRLIKLPGRARQIWTEI